MKKPILSAAAAAFLISHAMADSRSLDLRSGFTGALDNISPRADRGGVTGYAVPLDANGGQVGANQTSRSGSTNVGGYVGVNMNDSFKVACAPASAS